MSKITLAQPSISKTSVVDIFIIFIGVRSGWLDKTNKPTTRHVVDVAISLRTAQEPERKTFVPVGQVEVVQVERQEQE